MKEYVIWRSTAADKTPERIVKTEEELTTQDKQLFLGDLMKAWTNSPPEVQLKFFSTLLEDIKK